MTIEDWKKHNALQPGRPRITIDQIPWHELNADGELNLYCEDPLLKHVECTMRMDLYKWKHFPCDMAFFPYLQVPKDISNTGMGVDTRVNEG